MEDVLILASYADFIKECLTIKIADDSFQINISEESTGDALYSWPVIEESRKGSSEASAMVDKMNVNGGMPDHQEEEQLVNRGGSPRKKDRPKRPLPTGNHKGSGYQKSLGAGIENGRAVEGCEGDNPNDTQDGSGSKSYETTRAESVGPRNAMRMMGLNCGSPLVENEPFWLKDGKCKLGKPSEHEDCGVVDLGLATDEPLLPDLEGAAQELVVPNEENFVTRSDVNTTKIEKLRIALGN
ncbi:hypothetical protein Ancab_021884 [Ancistrocladus abbreviatus]